MPRIDDALARARTYEGSEPPAAVPAVPDAPGAQFPLEAEEPQAPAVTAPVVVVEPAVAPLPDATHFRPATPAGPPADIAVQGGSPYGEKLLGAARAVSSVEQYRRLAARLYVAQSERATKVVMVTSSLPGEGKTLTAANLALTLSESYRRQVLLVDADLRRPCIHELFQIPNLTGLNEGLRADPDRKIPVVRLTDHLTILTAGRPEPDPMHILSSARMRQMLEDARGAFEWVIVDTPPIGLLSDARLLASLVDTVLLVVRAGGTPVSAIDTAIDAIGRDRILGVVLNRADSAATHYQEAYQYYASPRTQE